MGITLILLKQIWRNINVAKIQKISKKS